MLSGEYTTSSLSPQINVNPSFSCFYDLHELDRQAHPVRLIEQNSRGLIQFRGRLSTSGMISEIEYSSAAFSISSSV